MNYPSSPNPILTDEVFEFDDACFEMFMEQISLEDNSSISHTLSSSSSEKPLVAEVTSSLQTNIPTSPMSLDIEEKDEIKKRKRQKEDPIIHVFKTKSVDDKVALDDGYKWRKYGKKAITGSLFPRHYHKCSNPDCMVKKKIERDNTNPEYVLTTYKGIHNHASPFVVYCDYSHDSFFDLNILSFKTNNSYSNYSHSAPN